MPLPAVIFGSFVLLLLVAGALVVLNAVRRSRQGNARIEQRGWRRLADGPESDGVMAGWHGWPFLVAQKAGKVNDVVVGELDGVEFMSLRWRQLESSRGRHPGAGQIERYNMVALRCEATVPAVSVVRGEHRVGRTDEHGQDARFEVGDRRFDRRWLTLGDADAGRALLTPEVRAVMDGVDVGAWVFQPGWVVRVTNWTFWGGDDGMLEELERAAAPWRAAPATAWAAYGGQPRFATALGGGATGETPTTGPGRGSD